MDGWTDVSEVLRRGIYMLLHRGKVVYIGKARLPLAFIASHRELANRKQETAWVPARGITFDQVLVKEFSANRIDIELADLLAIYNPKHNKPEIVNFNQTKLTRRLGT